PSRAGFERRYRASFVFLRRVCYDALVGAKSARGTYRNGIFDVAGTTRMTDQSNPMNPTKAATTTTPARHGPGVAEAPAKPRILSGMRPTGRLHLGHLV